MQPITCNRCGTTVECEPNELKSWELVGKDLLCPGCVRELKDREVTHD
jgi:hypothetical protein